ncbi:MAG: hypothetical protein GY930_08970 [bacterium]|nr:hypothetical protein [bacterium]
MRTPTLLLLCLLGASCATEPKVSDGLDKSTTREAAAPADPWKPAAPAPKPRPWTKAFDQGAILMGNTIRVQGPLGMSSRAALTLNDEHFVLVQKRLPEGFLQVLTLRPEILERITNGTLDPTLSPELRCQVGRWTLVALNRIEVLERRVPCDVVVVAEGATFWQDVSGNEQREERLEFRGAQPKE